MGASRPVTELQVAVAMLMDVIMMVMVVTVAIVMMVVMAVVVLVGVLSTLDSRPLAFTASAYRTHDSPHSTSSSLTRISVPPVASTR